MKVKHLMIVLATSLLISCGDSSQEIAKEESTTIESTAAEELGSNASESEVNEVKELIDSLKTETEVIEGEIDEILNDL